MSKEEREKRRAEREAQKKRDEIRLPGVHYAPENLQLILRAGEGHHSGLIVRTDDLRQFHQSPIGGDSGWVQAYVPLRNIEDLARLIAALVARLNELIDEANAEIMGIPAKHEVRATRDGNA